MADLGHGFLNVTFLYPKAVTDFCDLIKFFHFLTQTVVFQ